MLLRTLLPGAVPRLRGVVARGRRRRARLRDGPRPAPAGPVPAGLDACRSLFAYEDVGRLSRDHPQVPARPGRARLAGRGHGSAGRPAAGHDRGTWAPTTAARRRQRGFDQAELLARGRGPPAGAVPCRPLLARKAGPPQTGPFARRPAHGPAAHRPGRFPGGGRRCPWSWSTTCSPPGPRWRPRRGRCGSSTRRGSAGLTAARTPRRRRGTSVRVAVATEGRRIRSSSRPRRADEGGDAHAASTPPGLSTPSGVGTGARGRTSTTRSARRRRLMGTSPRTIDRALRIIETLPPVRVELVAAASARLAAGERPSSEEIADMAIRRATCDLPG